MISQPLHKLLRTPIIHINSSHQHDMFQQVSLVTAFGSMTLIIENVPTQLIHFYQLRNTCIKKYEHENIFPLIYEQTLKPSSNHHYLCLTLMEEVQILHCPKIKNQLEMEKIVCCFLHLEDNTQLQFINDAYSLNHVFRSTKSNFIYMSYAALTNKLSQYKQSHLVHTFTSIIQSICEDRHDDLEQIILIKQKIYVTNRAALEGANSWFELANYLNLIPNMVVKVTMPNSKIKQKQLPISKINGKYQLEYRQNLYHNLTFIQGKCINCLMEVTLQQLRKSFFAENTLYVLEKQVYYPIARKCGPNGIHSNRASDNDIKVIIEEQQIYQLKNWLPTLPPKIPSETIFIKPNINKVECINFFITYFNYIKPIMNELAFIKGSNTLRINLTTQKYQNLIIDIIFHCKYVVKDSEISMILEKSVMKNCKLSLNCIDITDSLMLFLANSDKMTKISEMEITRCPKVTQNGINSLLISPYCKTLKSLTLSHITLTDTSIESITRKLTQLSKITINKQMELSYTPIFNNPKLQHLEIYGINVEINFSQNLKILKLDCQVSLDSLRNITKLQLQELRICLVEGKRNILNAFGNFYMKDSNPARAFAEGKAQKTLKKIDLSNSTVKLKILKPILTMQSLQSLIMNNYDKVSNDVDAISHSIAEVSLKDTSINMAQLNMFISKCDHFVTLNIANTLIKKEQIWQFLLKDKRSINILCINQTQYTNKYLNHQRVNVTCIKVYLEKFLHSDSDMFFNNMVSKICQTIKTIYLLCDQKHEKYLIDKVKKYLQNQHLNPPKNIFVNEIGYYQIFNRIIHKSRHIQSINQNDNVLEMWQQHQPIDSFTYFFNKALKQHPNSFLNIVIKGNKVLQSNCIKLINLYGSKRVQSIDFRDCLFKFNQVSELLTELPYLTNVNDGSYQLNMQGDTFIDQSQKYLKFFMRVQKIKTLSIKVQNIYQVQILYSVLFHIIDHHSQSIIQLSLNFISINNHHQSINFWKRVCSLPKLNKLAIRIYNSLKDPNMNEIFSKINLIPLKYLSLSIPYQLIPTLQNKQLIEIYLQFSDQSISDSLLGKIIKNITGVKQLTLLCDRCTQIVNLSKLSCISKFTNLQSLNLSFEYCPLKQSSIFQFVTNLKQLKFLKKLQINLSFTFQNWNELLKSIENLKQQLKNILIRIIGVNQNSKDFVFNRQQFAMQGVDFIM